MARADDSRQAYRGPIVVISEEDKPWMDTQIEEALQGGPPLNVRTAAAGCASRV